MSEKVFNKVEELIEGIKKEEIIDEQSLESFRIKYLGSKNIIKGYFAEIKAIPNEQKKSFGLLLNEAKGIAEQRYAESKEGLTQQASGKEGDQIDMTAPTRSLRVGSRHPISIAMNRIIEIFSRIGFVVAEDREIEDDWHNFTAMNTPEYHPARDMQDTFYLKDSTNMLLRTHTSSVQARVMTSQKPPIRIIAPGRVFRNETISARSHCQFHQLIM